MSKPPLSTDLANYNTSLAAHIPDTISRKTPSPKGQRARERKRDISDSDLSGGKEGQKSSRTDQVTPPNKIVTTISPTSSPASSPTSSPTSSPSRSLKSLTCNQSKEVLSLSMLLHSPVHPRSRSPSPSYLEFLAPKKQAPQPLHNQDHPNTNNIEYIPPTAQT